MLRDMLSLSGAITWEFTYRLSMKIKTIKDTAALISMTVTSRLRQFLSDKEEIEK